MKLSAEFLKTVPCEKPVFSSFHGKKGRAEYHLTESVLNFKDACNLYPTLSWYHVFLAFGNTMVCSQQHICTAVAGCVKIFEQNFTLNVEAVCHSRDFLFSFKIIVLKCSHGH